jgi:PAS domain S-box-containing protein
MTDSYHLLALDDDINQGALVQEFLEYVGPFKVDVVSTVTDFWNRLKFGSYDLLMLDYRLPGTTGLDILSKLNEPRQKWPVIMVTGQGDERIAVKAIQCGAFDYVVKTGDYLTGLPSLIKKAIEVHQLKQSVERSMEQVRYQALLLNNMRDAVVVWDMQGKITFWNAAAMILFGWSPMERIGKSIQDVYLPTFTPKVMLPRPENTSGQEVERQYETRNGQKIWISSRIMALHDAQVSNRLIGYMDVSRDITRRKLEQQALYESEARYRAIVEDYQTEMICRFLWDGALTFVNETYCKYFQMERDELLGKNYLEFTPAEEHALIRQELEALTPEEPVTINQHTVCLGAGEIRWQEWTDRAIFDDHGNFLEFQSVRRDITERKRMEAQIQSAQAQLAQAARLAAIGELASSVAHLISNPLTTVIAEAQLVLQENSLQQPVNESARAIVEAGWRAQKVVQQLLEFSQPVGDIVEAVDLQQTIENSIALAREHNQAHGANLTFQKCETPLNIRGNPRQLVDLWINLILAFSDLSQVGVLPSIRITTTIQPDGWIIVELINTDLRLTAEQIDTIFEPVLISPASGRGTGMELVICREIVRQHNGKIIAESLPDLGTIFRVTIPAEA